MASRTIRSTPSPLLSMPMARLTCAATWTYAAPRDVAMAGVLVYRPSMAQKKKPPAKRRKQDGYYNLATGLGVTGRDPSTATQFTWAPPIDAECAMARYEGSPYAARIVDALPAEAMRRPIHISVAEKGDADKVRAAEDMVRLHQVHEKLSQAARWGRATGGGAVLMVTDDGPLDEPLDLDRVTELRSCISL